eukprot:286221_1
MATNNAIITLVTSEDFVIGAQVMVHSLIETNPNIDELNITIGVMVTKNICNESRKLLLLSGFNIIIEIDAIPNPNNIQNIHVSSWYNVGFTKLRIWSLISYNKILYIDSDCIIIQNILHLLIDKKYLLFEFAASPDIFPPDNFNAGVM